MQLIADILSFTQNQDSLSNQLRHTAINWDTFVVIGSQHLMLPALYCRLKEKDLLPLIPEDLNNYLEEIAEINRGRNEKLLTETHEISEILNTENINHVFIKGIALLASNTFKDPTERMIGDMDILIANDQLELAFNTLAEHGYTDVVSFNFERKNFRHLSRQVSKDKFGAIELHSEILLHNYRHLLNTEQVLKNKRIVNGIAIPSTEDLIRIAILALQINDRAHYLGFLGFKTVYDCLALNLISNQRLLENLSDEKYSQSFLNISNVLFKEFKPYKSSKYSIVLTHYLKFRLNYPKFGALIYLFSNMSLNVHTRLRLFANNKSYRRHILKNKIRIYKNNP